MECWWWRSARLVGGARHEDGDLRAFGWPRPLDHHFLPLRTISSPSTMAVACMLVASDDATSGSVMQNTERISPASSGVSQRAFCSSVPYFQSTSMLPVSGALQLKTSGAMKLRPISSASGAYSSVERPAPSFASGRNRFHRPSAFARAFSSSITTGHLPRPPVARHAGGVDLVAVASLDRFDVLAHEALEALQVVLGPGARLEVHRGSPDRKGPHPPRSAPRHPANFADGHLRGGTAQEGDHFFAELQRLPRLNAAQVESPGLHYGSLEVGTRLAPMRTGE